MKILIPGVQYCLLVNAHLLSVLSSQSLYVPIFYPFNLAVPQTSFNSSKHFPSNNLLGLVECSHPSKTSLNMIP